MAETTVTSVIDSQTVLTHMTATNKDDALRELAATLSDAGYLNDTAGYIHDVYQREKEGPTGIGNYIAIPHGKSDSVSKIGVAIGILDHEIDWETIDDHGVKVIILFAVGSDTEGAKEHLKLLSLFARKLGRDAVIEALLTADSAKDVKEAFNN
ncbi:PTS sugar transporter subunit IIA [Lactiplantibacillus plantarum]|uniref:PTS sugar transporter subunit IIA n=1 Tax=Lactiplantibacillus plantarum TaxID=1590 RepID=UPI001B32F27A|nr:fructose PTS transporter subunit IIA [Lactiplantibacillus plantarum]MBP5815581.1 PTS sugar transporter subunit IIA [Lactiplantibacillus plantarum]